MAVALVVVGLNGATHPGRRRRLLPVDPKAPVSFYKGVMPILQRKCQGCHQPAKANGKLNLTGFDEIKKGGRGRPGVRRREAGGVGPDRERRRQDARHAPQRPRR